MSPTASGEVHTCLKRLQEVSPLSPIAFATSSLTPWRLTSARRRGSSLFFPVGAGGVATMEEDWKAAMVMRNETNSWRNWYSSKRMNRRCRPTLPRPVGRCRSRTRG